ncbi:MAG: ParB/RepB/Spo0J family partition protein [Candidatus Aminicenantes bacterium]|nr:ParB/RepB/Spo0J family partition protein [Candidatus Aminicenantes bacterium]
MKRKVLGKGIEAIISNHSTETSGRAIVELNVEDISPNPFQPRKTFSPEKLRDLADSIQEAGMIQPVVVYKKENKYYLMVGERRWRAVQSLKWDKIPALIKELTIDEIMIGTLIENIQREDLNAIEIAEGIETLMKKNNLKQEQASAKLGMNRTTLTNYLRLLKLPEVVKTGVLSEELSAGHARPLLSLRNHEDMRMIFSQIVKKKLSVRQTEALVKNFYKKDKTTGQPYDPDMQKIENKLTRLLSTKVKLKYSRSGTGKIEIYYSSLDEFERIYNRFLKE